MMEKAAVITIFILLLVVGGIMLLWEYFPESDSIAQEVCVEEHIDNTIIPVSEPEGNGAMSIQIHPNYICDKSQIQHCVRWRQERTWAGKPYRACEEYR